MTVTAAKGFRASGVAAGLKSTGALDVALVACDREASLAAVFTTNRVSAAPVVVSREVAARGRARAVVLNSGGANACTGEPGLEDARATARAVATHLGCTDDEVAVASTGLIGVRLPMDRLLSGVARAAAALATEGGHDAAEAIRTTDTIAKTAVRTLDVDGRTVTIGGMAKGAGMLAPALATMLVVITTDAEVAAPDLDGALRDAVAMTFDRIDSDGCMSTNDSVYLLASGASDASLDARDDAWTSFTAALTDVCQDLATQLIDDAEGASKRIAVVVRSAADEVGALEAARAVARSALLKCAIHGEDPNWGRVLSALGTTATPFDPAAVDVSFNGEPVCRGGVAAGDVELARVALKPRDVTIGIDLHAGDATATVLTTDLTAAYVHENSAYST
jgi:glutamate N-acetyltransferase/amino-acid N-acetyltransferase